MNEKTANTDPLAILTTEELTQKKEDYKLAKEQYVAQRAERKTNSVKQKKLRDVALDLERTVVTSIKSLIFEYNKLGKSNKQEFGLLEKIKGVLDNVADTGGNGVDPSPSAFTTGTFPPDSTNSSGDAQ